MVNIATVCLISTLVISNTVLAFRPRSRVPVKYLSDKNRSPLKSKSASITCTSEGFFRHPDNCKKFYRCVDFSGEGRSFTTFYFDCAPGTVFDESISVCNYPSSVPSCDGNYLDEPAQPVNPESGAVTTTPSSLAEVKTEGQSPPCPVHQTTARTTASPATGTKLPATTNPKPSVSSGSSKPPVSSTSDSTVTSSVISSVTTGSVTLSTISNSQMTGITSGSEVTPTTDFGNGLTTTDAQKEEGVSTTDAQKEEEVSTTDAQKEEEVSTTDAHKEDEVTTTNAQKGEEGVTTTGAQKEEGVSTTDAQKEVESSSKCTCAGPEATSVKPEIVTTTPFNLISSESFDTTTPTTGEQAHTSAQETESTNSVTDGNSEVTSKPEQEETTTAHTEKDEATNAPTTIDTTTDEQSGNEISTVKEESTTSTTSTTEDDYLMFQLRCGNKPGFRRHPLHCNRYYKCSSDGEQIKFDLFSCEDGQTFDNKQEKCLPKDEAEPCKEMEGNEAVNTLRSQLVNSNSWIIRRPIN